MTLEDLKQLYASDQGYDGWDDLAICNTEDEYDQQWRNVCILAQKEALKNAAREADLMLKELGTGRGWTTLVDPDTITDESNLIT